MSRSARDVALLILERLFEGEAAPAESPASPSLARFQREGVDRVRTVLARRGGAILADGVGLGKTYMALAIIERTIRAGGDAIVVVPASVRGMWRRVLHPLEAPGERWRLVTHTGLARGLDPERRDDGSDRIVIVDEAHRFRNPHTLRYAALARLLARPAAPAGGGRTRALLLTATPINNCVEDLLHLILLFARDDAFRDVGVPSLRDAFGVRGFSTGAAEPARDRIEAVVRDVVVRRTREMVSARFGEPDGPLRFPKRARPRVVRYQNAALPGTVATMTSLNMAIYALSDRAGASDGSAEPAGLILSSLLKRLDSSPAAFDTSVGRLRELTRASLAAARAGRILVPARRTGRPGGEEDPLQLTLVELVADPASPDTDVPGLVESLRQDLDTLDRLRSGPAAGDAPPAGPDAASDPKLAALLALLDELGGERALVFTEYRDTAAYLEHALVGRSRVGRVDGGGAWLGGRPAGRRSVVEAFAPHANGRDAVPDRERVDVLIATDVLAEGVNLQDARHLISYDMPWNPVRLMQRIGRVDRLGSMHAEVATYLFVPATGLEEMLGLMRRLRHKLDHITTLLGGEQADELLTGLANGAPSARPSGPSEGRQMDPMETLRTLWVREREELTPRRPVTSHITSQPVTSQPVGSQPVAEMAAGADHAATALTWVVLVRDAAGTALLEVDREGSVRSAGPRSVAALREALREEGRRGGGCDSREHGAAADPPLQAVRSYRAPAIATLRAPGPLRPRDPAALLARRIRRLGARAGVALDHRSIDRIDRVLDQLTAPLDPTRREEARSILESGEEDLERLLDRADRALNGSYAPRHSEGHAPSEVPDGLRILAALHIRVDCGDSPG